MDNVELKRKVTLKRKGASPATTPLPQSKRTKWWLWLLPVVIIGAVLLIVQSEPSGNDTASVVGTESTPVEQAPVANDTAMPVAPTESSENSQSSNEPSQATTTPSGSDKPVASEKPSTPSSDTKANNGSTAASTAANSQKPVNSVQPAVSGVDEKAWKAIKGRFGNGEDRKQILGAEYKSIQRRVNELYKSGQVQ